MEIVKVCNRKYENRLFSKGRQCRFVTTKLFDNKRNASFKEHTKRIGVIRKAAEIKWKWINFLKILLYIVSRNLLFIIYYLTVINIVQR